MTDLIEPDRLRAALVTSGRPWREVEHHASTTSTNARALELATPWTVVVADHQSAGRGRMARPWESPAGASLLLTAILPLPDPATEAVGWLPLLTGLAVARAVREETGVATALKWPNDVLVPADDDRKLCGILCEVGTAASGVRVVVVGIGLNLTQGRADLPVPTATSLALAAGPGVPPPDPTGLAVAVLTHLADAYAAATAGGSSAASERAAYRSTCATLGQEVRLSRIGADDVVGRALAVDDGGRLVIDVAGERTVWAAGDVVHVRRVASP